MKKLYDTLEIPEGSSEQEVSKAYKNLARKYHPDRNKDPGAEEKFKDISHAYEVLSDPEKKSMYDHVGDDMFSSDRGSSFFGGGGDNINPFDLFSQMFGRFGGGGDAFSDIFGRAGSSGDHVEDIVIEKNVSLKDLYTCASINIDFERKIICISCQGTGMKNSSTKKKNCEQCNGSGKSMYTSSMGPFVQQVISTCSKCNGRGVCIDQTNACAICKGTSFVNEKVNTTLKLERDHLFQKKIILPVHGHKSIHGRNGRVILILSVSMEKQEYKIYKNVNLYREIPISLSDAINGFAMNIEYIDGNLITIQRENQITQPSSVYQIRGMGYLPNGNLYIRFVVVIPENIPSQIRSMFSSTYTRELVKKIAKRTFDLESKVDDF
jgi:DnaJ-related protein SCJ1